MHPIEKMLREAMGAGQEQKKGGSLIIRFLDEAGKLKEFNAGACVNQGVDYPWPSYGAQGNDGDPLMVTPWPTTRGWRVFAHSNSFRAKGVFIVAGIVLALQSSEFEGELGDNVESAVAALAFLRELGLVGEDDNPCPALYDPEFRMLPGVKLVSMP